jgi:ABC transport system ATP-binding/permease protein
MSYVLVEKLIKNMHDKVLINDATFAINKGDKIALVGKNGSGKSTLLKIINEKEGYDGGRISKQSGVSWGFLEQDSALNPQNTIKQELMPSNSPIFNAVRLYEEALQNPDDSDKMQQAFDLMNQNNAWEYEERIRLVLEKLKLDKLDGEIGKMSGGQRKRISLAKVLIDTPDFLIMDEPTNHLDLEMIDWLEDYLVNQDIALLLVTHDRYFLDAICNQILELSGGKIFKHAGNYSYYLEQKEFREEIENLNIDKARSLLKKELNWVRTQPQGRQTKAKARVNAYYEKKENLGKKHTKELIQLDSLNRRLGAKVLEIYNLSKSFDGKRVLDGFTYSFTKGEKLGIIGKNGVGKTTFLNLLMGLEEADSGKIVRGETVTFGYYTQHQQELDPNDKVIDSVKRIANNIKMSDGVELSASKLLERFLFSPNDQQKQIRDLSGGEKKRVCLLQILIKNPNFLILDEPTNDFDLMTLEVLGTFLRTFKGNVIIISHDRYFMDSVVDHLFLFKGNGLIKDFPGNYSDYRESELSAEELKDLEEAFDDVVDPENLEILTTDSDNSPKSKNEASLLYKEIGKLEKKIAKLNEQISNLGSDYIQMAEISKQIKNLEKELEEKTERWVELS